MAVHGCMKEYSGSQPFFIDSISRTQMVFNCLDEICYKFDLEKPMWLDATVQDFKYHDKARFTQDNFIETVDFDYLEIQVIEE